MAKEKLKESRTSAPKSKSAKAAKAKAGAGFSPELAATLPQDVDALEANFEVHLTPDAFDIGRFAQLLGETRLEARDPQVNEAVLLSQPGLSTDLSEDEAARGKGVVRAALN